MEILNYCAMSFSTLQFLPRRKCIWVEDGVLTIHCSEAVFERHPCLRLLNLQPQRLLWGGSMSLADELKFRRALTFYTLGRISENGVRPRTVPILHIVLMFQVDGDCYQGRATGARELASISHRFFTNPSSGTAEPRQTDCMNCNDIAET